MSGRETDIWMPLAIGAYLSKTMHLTTLHHGAYLLLLMDYWKRGPLPNNQSRLATICKMDASSNAWADAWDVLGTFFTLGDDGLLHNERADREIAKADANHSSARDKAKKAAESRWSKQCPKDAPSISQAMPRNAPSPSPTDKETNTPLPPKGGRKSRRNKTEILSPYPETVSQIVNDLIPDWPKRQPKDNAAIHIDLAMTAQRVDEILRDQPSVTPELLEQAGRNYLGEKKNYYRAPQFFFGPSPGDPTPPWTAYVRLAIHQQQKASAQ